MTTPIIIRETEPLDDHFAATIQFDPYGAPYEITVHNPFAPAEEAQLEWYFEEWLTFPFTDKVKAAETAASLRRYGEDLFGQLFRDNPDVYLEYQRLRGGTCCWRLWGRPNFTRYTGRRYTIPTRRGPWPWRCQWCARTSSP